MTKIYVLTSMRVTCHATFQQYLGKQFDCYKIDGSCTPQEKMALAEAFRTSKHKRVAMIATIDSVIAAFDFGPVDQIKILQKGTNPTALLIAKNRAQLPKDPS